MFHENDNVNNLFDNMCYQNESGILASDMTFNPGMLYEAGNNAMTPTTLENIEQKFRELQSENDHTSELRHIKSEPDDNSSTYGSEHSLQTTSGRRNDTFVVPNIDPDTYLVANSRRPTGRRKQKKNEILSAEEQQRRHMRRERNRLAAAKCRQKRDDHTIRLIQETEGLEEEQTELEHEIESLLAQKEQFEMILRTHQTSCNKVNNYQHSDIASTNNTAVPDFSVIQNTYVPQQSTYVPQQNSFVSQSNTFVSQQNAFVSQPSTFVSQQNTFVSQPFAAQPHTYTPQATISQAQMMEYSDSIGTSQRNMFNFDSMNSESLRQNRVPLDFSNIASTCSAELKRHSTDSSFSSEHSPNILCL